MITTRIWWFALLFFVGGGSNQSMVSSLAINPSSARCSIGSCQCCLLDRNGVIPLDLVCCHRHRLAKCDTSSCCRPVVLVGSTAIWLSSLAFCDSIPSSSCFIIAGVRCHRHSCSWSSRCCCHVLPTSIVGCGLLGSSFVKGSCRTAIWSSSLALSSAVVLPCHRFIIVLKERKSEMKKSSDSLCYCWILDIMSEN